MSDPLSSRERAGRSLWLLLAGALVLRCGLVLALAENLTDDRDIYLSLARGLREMRGFSIPGSEQPTAFRPPMYPLMLAAATAVSEPVGVAAFNILLGVGTVALTSGLALRLGLSRRHALIAGGIIAVDPLLLLYTTFPMTEVLCAFLGGALLLAVCPPTGARNPKSRISESSGERWRGIRRGVVAGAVFGLCVLSRPTFWVFGGLMAALFLVRMRSGSGGDARSSWKLAGVTATTVLLMTAAWPIRNLAALGSPILTTTHGGYTLLLGNNPAFYKEVVGQPWRTVWDGSRGAGQAVWVESVNDQMRREGVAGEVESDRWMSARAWNNIREEPGVFARACLLRFARFWNIVPSGPAADALPRPALWMLGSGYVLLFAAAVWGAVVVLRERRGAWMPALLLVLSFTLVHLVYWSNARMRAPVMPAVAALAAAGVARRRPIRRRAACSVS